LILPKSGGETKKMKITKEQLKTIIKEEISSVLSEQDGNGELLDAVAQQLVAAWEQDPDQRGLSLQAWMGTEAATQALEAAKSELPWDMADLGLDDLWDRMTSAASEKGLTRVAGAPQG